MYGRICTRKRRFQFAFHTRTHTHKHRAQTVRQRERDRQTHIVHIYIEVVSNKNELDTERTHTHFQYHNRYTTKRNSHPINKNRKNVTCSSNFANRKENTKYISFSFSFSLYLCTGNRQASNNIMQRLLGNKGGGGVGGVDIMYLHTTKKISRRRR